MITGAAGAVVSMTIFLLAPREPAVPGAASVRVAVLPTESLIVPPAVERLLVAT